MATYDYKCSDCGESFAVKASLKEKEAGQSEKFSCPKCQSKNIKREFSAANFIKNIFQGDDKPCGCSGGKACHSDIKPEPEKGDCCGGSRDCC